jgi:hypothetical protein
MQIRMISISLREMPAGALAVASSESQSDESRQHKKPVHRAFRAATMRERAQFVEITSAAR